MSFVNLIIFYSGVFTYCTCNSEFITKRDELPWPLPDPTDHGVLMAHAQHCLSVVKNFANHHPETDMEHMHKEHCGNLTQRVANFTAENPIYEIPMLFCSDLLNLRQNKSGCPFGYNSNVANASSSEDHEEDLQNENEKRFCVQMGENFGKLLFKEWKSKETLSKQESKYLNMWNSIEATNFAAVGFLCEYLNRGETKLTMLKHIFLLLRA